MIEENPDQIEMIHVWFWYRKISAFDIAVICRQVEWGPCAFIREIHIRAVFDEPGRKFIVSVVRRREQRRPAVFCGLIHICSCSDQQLRGCKRPCACGKNKGSKPTTASTDQTGDDDV